jgi:hypothetical protein
MFACVQALLCRDVALGCELHACVSVSVSVSVSTLEREACVILQNVCVCETKILLVFLCAIRGTAHLELMCVLFFPPLKVANQWLGATAMWLAQGKIKKKYNISDERKALHECVERWTSAVGKKVF